VSERDNTIHDNTIQGFSNGVLGPPWGHGAVLWGPRAEVFTR